jgi:hypothetical protein
MNLMEVTQKLTAGELAGWAVVLIVLLFSLIQISPLRLNPWDNILGWVGQKVNGDMQAQLKELKKHVQDMWVASHRQTVLMFAREARAGVEHSSDEWTNVLNMIAEYEAFCQGNTITNGIVKADSEYIRNLYQELSREHRI